MSDEDRYVRQRRLHQLGDAGQARLAAATVAVVGCGATGGAVAESLARAGVGGLRLIDRDTVERSNLHRQRLFDEADADAGRPKALAGAERLRELRGDLRLEPEVVDLTGANAEQLLAGVDAVADGTDSFAARYVIDEAARELDLPWVHAAVVGVVGQVMAVVPGQTPCYRCLLPDAPPAGSVETCESAGVLGPAVDLVGALAATELIKQLTGAAQASGLAVVDLWAGSLTRLAVRKRKGCRGCAGERRYLGQAASAARLCGRGAVQLPSRDGGCDLGALAQRLGPLGEVRLAEGVLRARLPEAELLVFGDGRALVKGLETVAEARAIADRYLG